MRRIFVLRPSWLGAGMWLGLVSCAASPTVKSSTTVQHQAAVSSLGLDGGRLGLATALSPDLAPHENENPFSETYLFVNPAFTEHVRASSQAAGLSQEQFNTLAYSSTALWLDNTAMVG